MSEYSEEYRISQLCAKYMAQTITPEEQEELDSWKNSSDENALLFEQICFSDRKYERNIFVQSLDMRLSWKKLHTRLNLRQTKSRSIFSYVSIAATITLFIGIGVSILYQGNPNDNPSPVTKNTEIAIGGPKAILVTPSGRQISLTTHDNTTQTLVLDNGAILSNNGKTVEYIQSHDTTISTIEMNKIVVPRGGEFELVLPDNTRVWINSDSELNFPTKFDKDKRVVTLQGEAYFSVTKDAARPFTVQINQNIKIEVLGTEFNVQAYQDANTIETTLSSGSVKIFSENKSLQLKPNEQAVYRIDKKTLTSHEVDASKYAAWKEGKFIFEDTSLELIMTTLSRWYDIQVFYSNETIKQFHFTGDLQRYEDFNKTLQMLERATSIRFVVNGKTVMVEELK